MIIVKTAQDSEAVLMPTREFIAEMESYHEELADRRLWAATQRKKRARPVFGRENALDLALERNVKISATEGPHAETKGELGGDYLVDILNLNEAKSLASPLPGGWIGCEDIGHIDEDNRA